MPEPTKIPRAFAASGDKNSIPDSSGSPGFASWQEGFPAITSEPFAQGGIAPKRADFNGIFNALSAATIWQQQGGVYAYDNATDYEIGNVVLYNGDLYKCLSANGPSSAVKAPTDTTVWAKVILTTATQSAAGYMSAADKTALDNVSTTYLPLAGGTLTGDITTKNIIMSSGSIRTLLDSQALYQYGGTGWQHGAQITLFGKDHSTNPGDFTIHADNGVNSCDLYGRPNGTLKWGGNDVITSAGGTITGSIYAPTPSTTDSSTKIATTAYVQNNIGVVTSGSATRTSSVTSDSDFTWWRRGNLVLLRAQCKLNAELSSYGNVGVATGAPLRMSEIGNDCIWGFLITDMSMPNTGFMNINGNGGVEIHLHGGSLSANTWILSSVLYLARP